MEPPRSIALDRDSLTEAAHGVARLVIRGGLLGAFAGVVAFGAQMALGWYGHSGWSLLAWLLLPVFGAVAAGVGVYVGGVLGARRAAHTLLRESGLLAAMVSRVAGASDAAAEVVLMRRDDVDLLSKSPVAQQVKGFAYPILGTMAREVGPGSAADLPQRVDAKAKAMIDRWGRIGIAIAVVMAAVVLAAPAAIVAVLARL